MTGDESPVILLVDDEPDVVEVYELCLADEYTVRTATGGREALAELDETVDVVLLDRRMPELSGDEVLDHIRERGYDCRVAMVTAVHPDFEIIEMDFDAYLTKPVDEEELVETTDQLLAVRSLDQLVQEQFALAQKRAALEREKPAAELDGHDAYADLTRRLDEVESRSDRIIGELSGEQFAAATRDFGETENE